MQYFSWQGIDEKGKQQKGKTEASSQQDLKNILLKEKIALIKIKRNKTDFLKKFLNLKKIHDDQIIHFFQSLSFLLSSGIDLVKSLNLITNQTKSKKFKTIISSITRQVEQGETLSQAIKQHNIFNIFTIWMIESGEKTGKLDFTLKELSDFLLMKQNLTKKLKQAALLPTITLIFSLFIMFIIFVFIIPQFESLFINTNQNLPVTTQFVLNTSRFLRFQFGLTEFSALIIILLTLKLLVETKTIRKWKDYIIFKIFFIKNIVLNFNLIHFMNTLSLCLKSGVSLQMGLVHCKNISSNYIFKSKVSMIEKYIRQGKSFSQALSLIGNKYFDQNLIAATKVGEESGNLGHILKKQSTHLEKKLKSKLDTFTTILQPSLMIIIGIFIAFIIYSVYIPIFNMATAF